MQGREAQDGGTALKEGQLYELDGGVFRAKWDADAEQFSLWTHMGMAGRVVGRTGFDINEHGQLYDRVYDIETEEYIHPVPARFTLADLKPAPMPQVVGAWTQRVTQQRNAESVDVSIWDR